LGKKQMVNLLRYTSSTLFILLPLIGNGVTSAQQSPKQIFSFMRTTIANLQNSRLSQIQTAKDEMKAISDSINELERLLQVDLKSTPPPAFVEALEMDANLLEIISKKREVERALALLREVRSSIELKVKFAKSSKGNALRLIQLLVRTVHGQSEVSNYEVWYVPRGWADVPDKFRRFDDLSSPAIKDMPAGNYIIWVQVTGKIVTERTPITLGDDGSSKRKITLSVP
jgi:hypothetical protein